MSNKWYIFATIQSILYLAMGISMIPLMRKQKVKMCYPLIMAVINLGAVMFIRSFNDKKYYYCTRFVP